MVKLITAALVVTALTVPVSMSNLGQPDDTVGTEQQQDFNQVTGNPVQSAPAVQPPSNRSVPQNLRPLTSGDLRFQTNDNPSTIQLADYPGNTQVPESAPQQETGSGLRAQFENPAGSQPASQPQNASGVLNSLRDPSSAGSWQQPQTQPATSPGFENQAESRSGLNETGRVPDFGNQQLVPSTGSGTEPRFGGSSSSPTIQDRSVMQAGWPQQPANAGSNPTTIQSVQPAGPQNLMQQLDPAAAKNVLEQLDQFAQAQTLPGTPLTLQEALQQTPPELRKRMVAAYWQAWRDRFLLTSSEQKYQQLHQMDQSGTFGAQGLFAQQLRNAETDAISRQLALRRSQMELKQFFPSLQAAEYFPLPVDMPVTSGYETHYQWYANNGHGDAELKLLDDSLPMVLELVQEHSDTALRVSRSAERMMQMAMSGQGNPEQLLATLDRAQMTTGNCLESLRQYNATISDYSIALRPDIQSSFDLAKMLVPARRTTSINLASQPVRTADLRVKVPSQSPSNQGFNPSTQHQGEGEPASRFDANNSGSQFQPMSLPGSGNLGTFQPPPADRFSPQQPPQAGEAQPVTLQPLGPTSNFNSGGQGFQDQSAPPSSQPPPARNFGSGQ